MHRLVKQLTLEEKAKLTVGIDRWQTAAIPRLGIPSIRMNDGPNGVRKEDESVFDEVNGHGSFPATCFPCISALANSWDAQLCRGVAGQLGAQAKALGVNVLLGPGINHKRTPVGGRNFEYFSEDPHLTGELASAYVEGLQETGVACSLKHFYGNNTEYNRFHVNVKMSERARREIYLPAFERVVRGAKPRTVMAAYNRLDGVYCSENERVLNGILRGEWGFEGLVVSDWDAVHDKVASVRAGCDLEMPFRSEETVRAVIQAVQSGALREEALDRCVDRILCLIDDVKDNCQNAAPVDWQGAHRAAVAAAEKCAVLLKNTGGVLPLEGLFCFIGAQARENSYQGGGSSHVNTPFVPNVLAEAEKLTGKRIPFARGYSYAEGGAAEENAALAEEAAALARAHAVAIVFLGYNENVETESRDRADISLPAAQNELVARLCAAGCKVVAVLFTGAPVEMPWAESVQAILQVGLAGEGSGLAAARLLLGLENPSGRLAETYPRRLEDNPSYPYYAADPDVLEYGEGIFTGYRYYVTENVKPLFPFGYGLSYTDFSYGGIAAEEEGGRIRLDVTVRNTGKRAGGTLVQWYVSCPQGAERPAAELKAFSKVYLAAGESAAVRLYVEKSALSRYDEHRGGWAFDEGEYTFSLRSDCFTVIGAAALTLGAEEKTKNLFEEKERRAFAR